MACPAGVDRHQPGWQGRASDLVAVLDEARSFYRGVLDSADR